MHHIVQFLQTNGGELLYKTYEHITISLIAVILGVLVAVPLGVVLTRMKKEPAPLSALSISFRRCRVWPSSLFYPAPWCREGSGHCGFVFLFRIADSSQHVYRHSRRQQKSARVW